MGLSLHFKQQNLSQKDISKRKNEDPFLMDLRFHDLRHEATSRLAEIFPLHELTKNHWTPGYKNADAVLLSQT